MENITEESSRSSDMDHSETDLLSSGHSTDCSQTTDCSKKISLEPPVKNIGVMYYYGK